MTRTIPPVALAAGATLAQVAIARGRSATPASRIVGLALALPSLYFLADSVQRFRRARTTVDPRESAAATALVTTGPNAHTRNPMYVGMTGLLLAHAAVRRSPIAALPAALFLTWIDRVQIPMEERHLAEQFGQHFEEYARDVRRWL